MSDDEPHFYDPDGNPLTLGEWAEMLESSRQDMSERSWWRWHTELEGLRVSTVWMGLDHSFLPGEPAMFWETMILCDDDSHELDNRQWRFGSKEAAFAHHEWVVTAVKRNLDPDAALPAEHD
jgi:hypothetical protein